MDAAECKPGMVHQYNPESEEDVLKFLDYYLKQKANEWTQTSPVRIDVNVVGGNRGESIPNFSSGR